MVFSHNWRDYELIDASDGERLERWGSYTVVRPDPQVIWTGERASPKWSNPDAVYRRSASGGGAWDNRRLPAEWSVGYPLKIGGSERALTFRIRPMAFKHMGVFPEQAANWERTVDILHRARLADPSRPINVLNLFAYTGGATIAAAAAGAQVCHVDASKGMVQAARENAALSGLGEAPIRYIVDDCAKFVEREIKRGRAYDAIILDPPSYGRGPSGEVWKLEDSICDFLRLCLRVLSEKPLFVLLNSYTAGLAPSTMGYMLELLTKKAGLPAKVECSEVGLPVTQTGGILPCGAKALAIFENRN